VLMPVWSMDFSSIPPFVIRQENTKMEWCHGVTQITRGDWPAWFGRSKITLI
jgi:hypothetical protein